MKKVKSLQGPWELLAHRLSEVSNPLFVAIPTFFVIAWTTAPNRYTALLWWILVMVGISLAPFLFILQGVRRGRYSDRHVSVREQRCIPLLFGIGCVSATFLLLLFFHASIVLIATMTAVIVALVLSLLVTRYWKISIHLVGMAGAVTVFVILFGPRFLFLLPLVLIVA